MNIALISCVSQKCDYRTKAGNMYTSPLFTKSMNYAENVLRSDKIFILSAKYGLLPLDKEIEPYNLTLKTMNREKRREWAKMVLQQLKAVSDISQDKFIFLAGNNYCEDLIQHLPISGIPMKGLRFGERLQLLNECISSNKLIEQVRSNSFGC